MTNAGGISVIPTLMRGVKSVPFVNRKRLLESVPQNEYGIFGRLLVVLNPISYSA